MSSKKQIAVTLVRSMIGCTDKQKSCVRGLGLRKIRQRVLVEDTACNRGMANKVSHMVKIEEVA